MPILKRQFITDESGNRIGVILPMEEYNLVKSVLEQTPHTDDTDADKLADMALAAEDPLFLADLQETMADFAQADGDWWESNQ